MRWARCRGSLLHSSNMHRTRSRRGIPLCSSSRGLPQKILKMSAKMFMDSMLALELFLAARTHDMIIVSNGFNGMGIRPRTLENRADPGLPGPSSMILGTSNTSKQHVAPRALVGQHQGLDRIAFTMMIVLVDPYIRRTS